MVFDPNNPGWWVDPPDRAAVPGDKPRRCLFLDRDGVVNLDHGYVHEAERFELVDGITELIREARARSFAVVFVTNQAGIARGYYTEAAFRDFTAWIFTRLGELDAAPDRVYYSPVHPDQGLDPYRIEHRWRKPGPGMIEAACCDLDLEPTRSLLIGDRLTDIEAGQAAGIGLTMLLDPAGRHARADSPTPDRRITSLIEARAQLQQFAGRV